jgi:hypothetical protein
MSLAPDTHTHVRQAAQEAHDHAHHDHADSQGAHVSFPPPRRADPGLSLLRMSALQRLALALVAVGAVWLGVVWAWS